MNRCHIDFETYSEIDLSKVGAYRYARHPSTEVLIVRYLLPGETYPVEWLPRTAAPPKDLVAWVAANRQVAAHNAAFERAVWRWCLQRMHPGLPLVADGLWVCTAAKAAASGLPRSLGNALKALGSTVEKDMEGAKLIKLFCMPRKPTKNDPRVRVYPEDEPERFKWFSQYCATDVLGEQELDHTLPDLTPRQKTMFVLDMRMNDRGIPIDVPLVAKALKVVTELEIDLHAKVVALTGGVTATQLVKFNNVLFDHDVVLPNLQAETVRLELKRDDLDPVARTLLELRTESGRASTKKLDSMMWCADPIDHVVQGSFLYHGAHTGRYAGRLVQPHNFIRGNLKPRQMATVFDLLGHADADLFKLMYDKPIDTIGQCMRGFIRAPKGKEFVIADYTAIEARVLAWVAGEEHMLQAYRQNLDVYKLMAIRLYACTMEDVADEQRRIAKNLVLGCGYQLGGPGFVLYAAGAGVALTEEFATRAVKAYRAGHPRIVESWRTVDQLFAAAVMNPEETFTGLKCKFNMVEQWLCVTLPSGRQLRYPYAQCVPGEKWGKPANMLSYRTEINGQFLKEKTYGGKLIENIVQAIAFDIMQEGMLSAETNGYPVVGTVHDEVLTLRTIGAGSAKELEDLVCSIPSWSKGIPLAAKGFVCERYRKD